MKNYIFLLFLLIMTTSCMAHELAIIQYPIIDLTNNLPVSDKMSLCENSHRWYQGLFNERVRCIESIDNYIKISFDNEKNKTDNSPTFFWTLKKNIIFLRDLENKSILQTIPDTLYGQQPTIILAYPWKNFSLGTRFKHLPKYDTKQSYGVVYAKFKKN